MNHEFDAIYEGGVFRPLQPIDLPENAQVHLQMHTRAMKSPSQLPSPNAENQVAALQDLIRWIESQPADATGEAVSARDHDQILYGWQK